MVAEIYTLLTHNLEGSRYLSYAGLSKRGSEGTITKLWLCIYLFSSMDQTLTSIHVLPRISRHRHIHVGYI